MARTLLLDPHEREHLFRLAEVPDSSPQADCQALSPTVQVLLDKLDPYPAARPQRPVRHARLQPAPTSG